ncbi:MAG: Rid family detoxifying hydrolase [Bacteroidetes bacterium]|nr:Rid family detoxifying hydrolase [Bacteroidota bacterium]MDA0873887.1 Rid family detoxifying hydrolase [Bacteroidota bacterium]
MNRFPFLLLFAALVLSACQSDNPANEHADQRAADRPYVEYLNPADQEEPGPFSDAVRVGNLLFLSGKIGILPGTRTLAEGGIQGEARQTMDNIQATLERWGSSLDRVVKCTVMIEDIAEWGAFNEVYVEYFPDHKPARSAFGADGLALGAAVEVECIATVD